MSDWVHHVLKPWFMIGAVYTGRRVKKLLERKRENGFQDARIAELDRAMTATIQRIGDNQNTFASARDVIVTVLDQDPYYGKYVLDVLLEELNKTRFFQINHKPYNFTLPGEVR